MRWIIHPFWFAYSSIIGKGNMVSINFPFILDKTFHLKKPLYILSSGFGINIEYYTKKIRFLKSTILKRKIEVVSLRGNLTKAQIERLSGGGGAKTPMSGRFRASCKHAC